MPARLHRERIARTGTTPAHWLLLTHGIFGAGSNWRGIARKINEQRPEWGVVLVDLRQHGRSDAGEPPHTIAACADDLRALIVELGDVHAIGGHSLGGKVILATRALVDVAQTWVLDASPSANPRGLEDPANSSARVLALMQRLPKRWPHRDDFVAAVVAEGHDSGLAQWLAMNVVPDGDQFALRLDLDAMHALLADYYARDLWDSLYEHEDDVEIVIATRSSTISAADRERLATAPSHVHVHQISAGHWLHIDAPAAVVELFATRLPANIVASRTLDG
jgi:esterase